MARVMSGALLLAALAALAALAGRVPGAIGQARAVVPRALLGPSDTREARVSQLVEHEGRAGAGAETIDSRGQAEAEPQGAEAKGSGG